MLAEIVTYAFYCFPHGIICMTIIAKHLNVRLLMRRQAQWYSVLIGAQYCDSCTPQIITVRSFLLLISTFALQLRNLRSAGHQVHWEFIPCH